MPSRSADAVSGKATSSATSSSVRMSLVIIGGECALPYGRASDSLFIGLWFWRRQIQIRHAERALDLGQLVQVNRADDVDDGDFFRLGADNRQAANLNADVQQINFDVVAILLTLHADDFAPTTAAKLRHNRFNLSHRVLVLFLEAEALDVDAFDVLDQVANLSIIRVFAGKELISRLHQTFIELHIDCVAGPVRQHVELIELQLRALSHSRGGARD